MINIIINYQKNSILGFEASGHAGYDDIGKDIVCAAVTILTFNTIDTFIDILNLEQKIQYNIYDNLIRFSLKKNLNDNEMDYSQLILKKYELGIKSLLQEYDDFIKLTYKEVHKC